ncbi:DNA polymerase IV [Gimesia maris]|uniref:DNA polymerase IV n=1 Tax=Gimesia maris TaxID=122 RepID=A0ABX5YRB6_9PLAN|nr:DNA polymerase IV [Gimesia maris]QDU16085.1 DNA polymerase IV [Gimesia maris]QEG18112.1 DNA polymerase IV [Gimesia maris]QGQ28877.1 DNA polymerase IV [Gimesia maris]
MRTILHVDMDAFYASIEERDHPELQGQPIIVGGRAEHRGVVSAANYPARKFGVHSAMPMKTARQLCPQAHFFPVRMSDYAEVSQSLQKIFRKYTPLVEPLSLDEAFLDVSGSQLLFGNGREIAASIKQEVRHSLQLIASVGVAPNKFLAKIASDADKPDGLVVVEPDKIQEFLDPLPVSRVWGIGKMATQRFNRLGIQTISQVRVLEPKILTELFGEQGLHLWNLSQGLDERAVIPERQAKSISRETTFSSDVNDLEILRIILMDLVEDVSRRLRKNKLRGKTIQLKIRYDDFSTFTRSITVSQPTDLTREIEQSALLMLDQKLPERPLSIRLIGVGVTGFQSGSQHQKSLFDEEDQQKFSRLDQVKDQIASRFGSNSIIRGNRIASDDAQEETSS